MTHYPSSEELDKVLNAILWSNLDINQPPTSVGELRPMRKELQDELVDFMTQTRLSDLDAIIEWVKGMPTTDVERFHYEPDLVVEMLSKQHVLSYLKSLKKKSLKK